MTNATFRNVDDRLLRQFKTEAVREKIKMGQAINDAIQLWLYAKRKKIDLKSVEKDPFWQELHKSIDLGRETSSNTIDRELYGDA
ncbi:MAG: hypothetical protein QGH39_12360 [Candidatus Thermoplasmatota archaeon]|jgi:hypothetical protein|nr:hypothetical protein [Candidatus Thermoplasmatota archaeon]MDP7266338.1 hypothetical protein [Candidatus Thermoplasmatota archaeon]